MEIIDNIVTLEKNKRIIKSMYEKYGRTPYQSFESLIANFKTKDNNGFKVFIDYEKEILSAFETYWYDNTWKCSIESYPFLCDENAELESFINSIVDCLKTKTLYFPKVYIHTNIYNRMIELRKEDTIYWDRLPVPIVDCKTSKQEIYEQEIVRYGKRTIRQRRKFDNYLYVKEVNDNTTDSIIKDIELKSWKRICKQDMLSRENQFIYYTNIIKNGLGKLYVAFTKEDNIPVSYRIDAITKDKVYFLKSSFKEEYKKYSPGSYLIATDLIERYVENKKYSYIDLCGSMNTLKNMVATNELKRIDICYPYDKIVDKIRDERTNFSKLNKDNYLNGNSIRDIYL